MDDFDITERIIELHFLRASADTNCNDMRGNITFELWSLLIED